MVSGYVVGMYNGYTLALILSINSEVWLLRMFEALTQQLAGVAPLANFLNNLKTRADIDAKLAMPHSVSIGHIHTKFR